jgi:hypothetical protein
MISLAISIIKDMEYRLSDGKCTYCDGLNPHYHQLAKQFERVGHKSNCRIGYILKEWENMKDFL